MSTTAQFPREGYRRMLGPRTWLAVGALVAMTVAYLRPSLTEGIFAVVLTIGWAVTTAAAWFLPAPRPVAELNAFTARGMWMLRALAATVAAGATATYGAYVGLYLQAHTADDGHIPTHVLSEAVFGLLLVGSFGIPWLFGLRLSADLLRP